MRFSIIVPIYHVEEFLPRCVDSILTQTYTDFEVLLVDDGSNDRCPEICEEYAKKDSRVRVIHKPNGGLVSARNAGIAAAKGDFITYVDGDDWVKPNLLEFVSRKMDEAPAPLDMVLFAAEEVYQDHVDLLLNHVPEGYYDRARLEKEIFPYLLSDQRHGFNIGQQIQSHTWNKPCRRELQQAYYVRDENIRMFTDVALTTEVLLNCQNIYICNELLYCYNLCNTGSILSSQKQKSYLNDSTVRLVRYLQKRLKNYGPMVQRQLNAYPAHLIIRSAIWEICTKGYFKAVRRIRHILKETHFLDTISLKGLPRNPKLLFLLFKLHLYYSAMLLCAIKARKATLRIETH